MDVKTILTPDGSATDPPFSQFVDLLSDRQQSEQLVRSIAKAALGDRPLLAVVARRSYTHELLFDKIMLSPPREERCVLRLHVWWPRRAGEAAEIDIHNHGRDFVARLLVGSYRHELWTTSAAGEYYHKYWYMVQHAKMKSSFEPDGIERLSRRAEHAVATGDWYQLEANALHRLLPDWERLTCSLVAQAPTRSKTSVVYSRAMKPVGTVPAKRLIGEGRLRNVLTAVVAALDHDFGDNGAHLRRG